jgi:Trk K+ transport system NAD-binding subunit
MHLIEQPLPTDWEGRPLPPAALHGDGIRVVAVTRAGMPIVEVNDLVGQEGDVLHLIVTHDVEPKLEALFPGVSIVPGPRERGNQR